MQRILKKEIELTGVSENELLFEVIITQESSSVIYKEIVLDNETYKIQSGYEDKVSKLNLKISANEMLIKLFLENISKFNLKELIGFSIKEFTSKHFIDKNQFKCLDFYQSSRNQERDIVYDIKYKEVYISEYVFREMITSVLEDKFKDHTVYCLNLSSEPSIYLNQHKLMIGNCNGGEKVYTYPYPAIALNLDSNEYYFQQPDYYDKFLIIGTINEGDDLEKIEKKSYIEIKNEVFKRIEELNAL